MEVSMATLLVSLWLKTLLNWLVLVVQKDHVGQNFWGVFCVSLALGDTLLHLSITCVFLAQDVYVFGLHLTKYHVCVLMQAACSLQGVLHWPVFLLSGLDVLGRSCYPCPHPTQRLLYAAAAFLLWTVAGLCIFSSPDSHPITGDEDDHTTLRYCYLMGGAQSRQVGCVSLLMLVGVACYIIFLRTTNTKQLRDCVHHFLSTWSCFLFVVLFLLFSGTEVLPYLELNRLCFIHCLFTTVTLRSCTCIFCTHTHDDTWKRAQHTTHTSAS